MDQILYIDDDRSNLTGFKYVFKNFYKIHLVESAKLGWDILEKNPIKVIITDQRMPELTGVQFLEQVAERYPSITRILLTAYTDVNDIIQAINKGKIYQFQQKPWDKDKLKIIIDNAIGVYNLRKENENLIKKLKKANNNLETINKNLEIEVERRTQEIIIKNQELELHKNHLEDLVAERTRDLEQAKLKAEESDRLKSAFLANMSHEIRTPMNAIMGFSTLLKENESTPKTSREYIDFIISSTVALKALIEDIMDISLIESDQLVFNITDFEITGILKEQRDYLLLNNPKKLNIIYKNQESESDIILRNDGNRFRQVISNLLDNAMKYTDTGEISFGFTKGVNEITFHVSDTGIGIQEKDQEKIFDHFHKLEYSDRLYSGAGIGLSICKNLINKMGGEIWVESTHGEGSTFYFKLPYDQNKTLQVETRTESIKKTDFERLNVLVAEDNPANFELIVNILKRTGATIHWAKNGKEAIEFIRQNPNIKNCIVLMDIKMPEVDGFEAHRKIKEINKTIPVIAVTALAQVQDSIKIRNEKFNDYLTKPFSPERLLKKISNFF